MTPRCPRPRGYDRATKNRLRAGGVISAQARPLGVSGSGHGRQRTGSPDRATKNRLPRGPLGLSDALTSSRLVSLPPSISPPRPHSDRATKKRLVEARLRAARRRFVEELNLYKQKARGRERR